MFSESDAAAIENQLGRILASKDFANAPRLRQFLTYAVTVYLHGNGAPLKETVIGTELFGRDADYDPTKDAVVRTTATRVRKRLKAYYETDGRADPWRIELPRDGYIPRISPNTAERGSDSAPPSPDTVPDTRVGRVFDANRRSSSTATALQNQRTDIRVVRLNIGIAVAVKAAAVLVTVALAFIIFRPTAAQRTLPIMPSVAQLTNDGIAKDWPILTDGGMLYFNGRMAGRAMPLYVPVAGGNARPLELPLNDSTETRLFDVRPGRRFLLGTSNVRGESALWEWVPGTAPRMLSPDRPNSAAFIPSLGRVEGFEQRHELRIFSSTLTRIVPFHGPVVRPQWLDSRKSLRFTVGSPEDLSLWEMNGLKETPKRLRGFPSNACCGTWSADGNLFVFLAKSTPRGAPAHGTGHGFDIWASTETPSRYSQPVRLTRGPLDYLSAVPSLDGRQIFAIGQQEYGELVRYDSAAKEFVPYMGGLSASQVDFSRDGKWITYVNYPGRELWRMRINGTDRVQLTFPPIAADEPHWSPNSALIAYMGELPDGHRRIFIVPREGGTPAEVAPFHAGDEGVPTWSPDGNHIIFGELLYRRPGAEMSVHILDVRRHSVEVLPGSNGVWTPRWSPDGQHVAGLTPDFRKLLLFDSRTRKWEELVSFDFIDHPAWSSDSSSIHFFAVKNNGRDRALYSWNLRTKTSSRLVDLKDFQQADLEWYGVAPDGNPLALRGIRRTEIYSLTLGGR